MLERSSPILLEQNLYRSLVQPVSESSEHRSSCLECALLTLEPLQKGPFFTFIDNSSSSANAIPDCLYGA